MNSGEKREKDSRQRGGETTGEQRMGVLESDGRGEKGILILKNVQSSDSEGERGKADEARPGATPRGKGIPGPDMGSLGPGGRIGPPGGMPPM